MILKLAPIIMYTEMMCIRLLLQKRRLEEQFWMWDLPKLQEKQATIMEWFREDLDEIDRRLKLYDPNRG
jgi:hypothetical protein